MRSIRTWSAPCFEFGTDSSCTRPFAVALFMLPRFNGPHTDEVVYRQNAEIATRAWRLFVVPVLQLLPVLEPCEP